MSGDIAGGLAPGPAAVDHPLAMLTGEEIVTARDVVRDAGDLPEGAVIAHVVLDEPTKAVANGFAAGDPVERRVRVLVVPGPELTMVELVVSVTTGTVVERTVIEGQRPALLMGECFMAILACKEHPDYLAALERRGITDPDPVQIDPWPAACSATPPRRIDASPGASRSCVKTMPTTDTPGRSRGSSSTSTWAAGR